MKATEQKHLTVFISQDICSFYIFGERIQRMRCEASILKCIFSFDELHKKQLQVKQNYLVRSKLKPINNTHKYIRKNIFNIKNNYIEKITRFVQRYNNILITLGKIYNTELELSI